MIALPSYSFSYFSQFLRAIAKTQNESSNNDNITLENIKPLQLKKKKQH